MPKENLRESTTPGEIIVIAGQEFMIKERHFEFGSKKLTLTLEGKAG